VLWEWAAPALEENEVIRGDVQASRIRVERLLVSQRESTEMEGMVHRQRSDG